MWVKIEQTGAVLAFGHSRFPGAASAQQLEPLDIFMQSRSLPQPQSRGMLDRVARFGKKLAAIGRTTIKVAPTLATLVAAWQASRVESWLPGGRDLSAVDWLRYRTPEVWASSTATLLDMGGPAVEDAVGLSLPELMQVDKHLYKMLSPGRDGHGFKQAPEFIKRLAEDTFSGPNGPRSAYVYLGDERVGEAREMMDLWRLSVPAPPNPYQSGDDRHFVWEALVDKSQSGKLPVFVDLDNDVRSMSNSEYLARETVNSLVERSNNLGGYTEANLYYGWLATRLSSYYNTLDPWLKRENPELHQTVEQIKENLTPGWLGGEAGIGPYPSFPKVDQALDLMKDLLKGPKTEFADAAIAMDRDLLTGVQSHWIKLLRETGAKGRSHILTTVARTWIQLNLKTSPTELIPPRAPILRALEGPPPRTTIRPYDRAIAFGEVVDHTLRGLGISERRAMLTELKVAIQTSRPQLEAREQLLLTALGGDYSGVDLDNITASSAGLAELKALWAGSKPLSPDVLADVGRHLSLLEWISTADKRYGDVDPGLVTASADFKDDPLGISEYFWQDRPQSVTGLKPGPSQVEWLGKGADTNGKLVSIVLEGGGGKGFAYVECLRQLRESLSNSNGRFGIDEFVGTSAGALTAGILAAGYTTEEVGDILTRLDFKKFNSDAVWMMGGVDPKVRGINRTGLFSQQKMYMTFYDLLSKKLGVEGRPILFRDLPYKLKVTTNALNTDIPPTDPLYNLIDGDGRLVLSSDTTPNFDVVGAIIASAAIPAFFAAPQMEVFRAIETEPGQYDVKRSRIQFVDGGLTDNLPVSSATQTDETALAVLPAKFEAVDPATGQTVSLSTLNFDPAYLPLIDAENARNYQRFSTQLGEFLHRTQADRLVLAMNLTSDQDNPALLGKSRARTNSLIETANQVGLPQHDGRTLFREPAGFWARNLKGGAFKAFLDGRTGTDGQRLEWSLSGSRIRVGKTEEEDIIDIARGAGAAGLATERPSHGFESS